MVAASDGAIAVLYRTAVDAEPIRVSACDAAAVEFESVVPIRRVRAYRGGRNFVGAWWVSTINRHVTFESWCERDHLITFDFDPHIVGVAAQPFRFEFTIQLAHSDFSRMHQRTNPAMTTPRSINMIMSSSHHAGSWVHSVSLAGTTATR